jgi:hypothetical protein
MALCYENSIELGAVIYHIGVYENLGRCGGSLARDFERESDRTRSEEMHAP